MKRLQPIKKHNEDLHHVDEFFNINRSDISGEERKEGEYGARILPMASNNNVDTTSMDYSESDPSGVNRSKNSGGTSNFNNGSNDLIKLYKSVSCKPVELRFIKNVIIIHMVMLLKD